MIKRKNSKSATEKKSKKIDWGKTLEPVGAAIFAAIWKYGPDIVKGILERLRGKGGGGSPTVTKPK